jgi:hypothetical protein
MPGFSEARGDASKGPAKGEAKPGTVELRTNKNNSTAAATRLMPTPQEPIFIYADK